MDYGVSIRAVGIAKAYGDNQALDGFELEVPTGSVCGLLGPNGAGKTTAVRVLTTLARPSAGTAEVAGFDVVRAPDEVRRRIGVVGQAHSVDDVLDGRTNLELLARLYHLSRAQARARTQELLERFDLSEAASRSVGEYSGGMRRRLDLAASLILDPDVLFLDEPTTGLDPVGRSEVWRAVRELVHGGTTVLLTTQYLEEADQLADTIAVVKGGRVIATGSPAELKAGTGGDRLEIVVADPADLRAATVAVERATHCTATAEGDRISVAATDPVVALSAALAALGDIAVADIGIRRPTLDEAFIDLTRQEVSA